MIRVTQNLTDVNARMVVESLEAGNSKSYATTDLLSLRIPIGKDIAKNEFILAPRR